MGLSKWRWGSLSNWDFIVSTEKINLWNIFNDDVLEAIVADQLKNSMFDVYEIAVVRKDLAGVQC